MTLYGIAPALMAWQARRTLGRSEPGSMELVPGGLPVLVATAAAAGGVIVSQWLH